MWTHLVVYANEMTMRWLRVELATPEKTIIWAIIPMHWSLNINSGHQDSVELLWLIIHCTYYCHALGPGGGNTVHDALGRDIWSYILGLPPRFGPVHLFPLPDSSFFFSPFPIIDVVMSTTASISSVNPACKLSNLRVNLGNSLKCAVGAKVTRVLSEVFCLPNS